MHSPRFLHALTLALGLAVSAAALAGAPQAKGQAPGDAWQSLASLCLQMAGQKLRL